MVRTRWRALRWARIQQVGGYSANVEQSDLMWCVEDIPASPGEIRIAYGERSAKEVLKRYFQSRFNADIIIPS
ncbi:MBL fold metallo-hydrolase RNA specificity domain-containing protein [Marinobacter qingdaonensis]|uniref:MBL fold metallo-hydrolase RNA specificity domain-containing protein n=1 Tax=Marinobacter qingdaonensis TaxID=3108486 RepID=UPI003CC6A4E4